MFQQILCLYMFMGILARVLEACSRVLFAGRRHGDVTQALKKCCHGINGRTRDKDGEARAESGEAGN